MSWTWKDSIITAATVAGVMQGGPGAGSSIDDLAGYRQDAIGNSISHIIQDPPNQGRPPYSDHG